VDVLGRALASLREAERLDPGLESMRALIEQSLAELEDAGAQLVATAARWRPTRHGWNRSSVAWPSWAPPEEVRGSVDELVARRESLAAELALASEGEDGLTALAEPPPRRPKGRRARRRSG